jgi:hypothetical protein
LLHFTIALLALEDPGTPGVFPGKTPGSDRKGMAGESEESEESEEFFRESDQQMMKDYEK